MKKTIVFLVVLALIQISAPVYMIVKQEKCLKEGVLLKFRTQPVDPYDAFRGRYIRINVESNSNIPADCNVESKQSVYAIIKIIDELGFARFERITLTKPDSGLYINARVNYCYNGKASLRLPFDRYYLSEKLAPAAEEAYRRHSIRENHDAYVTVRVDEGFCVLEELYIENKLIIEYLKFQK